MTLRDVAARSEGEFRASAVGGYERGDRQITVQRFCRLARLYGQPPDRVLADALEGLEPEGRREVAIDLTRIPDLPDPQARLVGAFVHEVRSRRGDYVTDVITLRAGDVESMALAANRSARAFLADLAPALRN